MKKEKDKSFLRISTFRGLFFVRKVVTGRQGVFKYVLLWTKISVRCIVRAPPASPEKTREIFSKLLRWWKIVSATHTTCAIIQEAGGGGIAAYLPPFLYVKSLSPQKSFVNMHIPIWVPPFEVDSSNRGVRPTISIPNSVIEQGSVFFIALASVIEV
ncbi:uncharacterized protein NDAI_0D05030 [Naumovozyma dairenensis CBS 421]|uniref:Uncharacterized protein n=1 Tax=Naumovozyma dairenensis (strain ATCC 10597 / BCRC 20456 / CBS 421 / NBRC 0211 / NRRL Y-12639) TaxID=1071378 RepID=G0WAK5_NAUDC|nr:hypothetical protein NDAI_0D05030 [Naumovozyma dairenensis CBS 421]CCD24816.1 hypothetical protein NDAI_0D05030 [Naumovozyma dairenensis CBS 421]